MQQNIMLHKRTTALVRFTRAAIARTTTARRGLNPRQLCVQMRLLGCLCLMAVIVPSLNSNLRSVYVCTCLSDCLVNPLLPLLLLLSSRWQPCLPLSIAVTPADTRWKDWLYQASGWSFSTGLRIVPHVCRHMYCNRCCPTSVAMISPFID